VSRRDRYGEDGFENGVEDVIEVSTEEHGKAPGSAFGRASSMGVYSRADRWQAVAWLEEGLESLEDSSRCLL
jgi:hypothetical protein